MKLRYLTMPRVSRFSCWAVRRMLQRPRLGMQRKCDRANGNVAKWPIEAPEKYRVNRSMIPAYIQF